MALLCCGPVFLRSSLPKVQNFMGPGVQERLAISCGATSKGYWHSAKTEGIQMALNNSYLTEQGLVSLRDIWISLRYGYRNAHCGLA